jgi:hypothetical protein
MTRMEMGMGERLAGVFHKSIQATLSAGAVLMAALVMVAASAAQSSLEEGAADVLGPHSDGARGCEVCHVPQIGGRGGELGAAAEKPTAA